MLSLHWSVQSHMPATKLYHIMYLSHHCSLPWVWWTCLYIHKGGTERAQLPPLQLPPCVPSSLYCNSSRPPSSLALVLVSNMSLSGTTKVVVQLWALGTKYRSNPPSYPLSSKRQIPTSFALCSLPLLPNIFFFFLLLMVLFPPN